MVEADKEWKEARKGHRDIAAYSGESELFIPELEAHIGEEARLPWLPDDEAAVAKYYPLGVSIKRLAEHTGHTVASVRTKLQNMGVKRLPRSALKKHRDA